MASILILGGSSLSRAFVQAIAPSHTVFVHGGDPSDAWEGKNVTALADMAHLPAGIDAVVDLTSSRRAKEPVLDMIRGKLPEGVILFTNVLTMTATEAAARAGARGAIGISYIPALFDGATLLEAAPALQTAREDAERGYALLREITGRELEIVGDRVGLVSARNLSMIINEAAFALMEGVAEPEDIDVAMKLGTNYPEGPLRWADRIGADIVLDVLQALHDEYQEERYRPCVLLKQYVRGEVKFYDRA